VLAVGLPKAPPMPAPCVVWGSPAPNRCRHPWACEQRCRSWVRSVVSPPPASVRQIAARRAPVRISGRPKPDFGPLPRNFADPLVGPTRLSWWNDAPSCHGAPIVATNHCCRDATSRGSWERDYRRPMLPLGPVGPVAPRGPVAPVPPCGRLDPCHRVGRSDCGASAGRTRITRGRWLQSGPWLRLPLHLWGITPGAPVGSVGRGSGIPLHLWGQLTPGAPVAPVAPVAPAPVAPVSPVTPGGRYRPGALIACRTAAPVSPVAPGSLWRL